MKFNPYLLLILLSVMIASMSQILLKISARRSYSSIWQEYLNIYVISGYGLLFLTTLLNIKAYSGGVELKNGAVIESLGLLFVTILSRLIFKETIKPRKIIGISLIMIGFIVFYL